MRAFVPRSVPSAPARSRQYSSATALQPRPAHGRSPSIPTSHAPHPHHHPLLRNRTMPLTASALPPASAPETAPYHAPQTMTQVLGQDPHATPQLRTLFSSLQTACKIIANKIARAGIDDLYGYAAAPGAAAQEGGRDAQKKLDVVANEVLKEVLAASGVVGLMASEEDDAPIAVPSTSPNTRELVVVFDPLDGSRNIEVSIPTGTIFGVYACSSSSGSSSSSSSRGSSPDADVLQPGSRLLAAGYALYSSATMMVISVGSGVHGFTLDPSIGEFVLSHPDMRIPDRGQIYSLNDARFHDWPAGLQRYIDDIRQGRGQNPKQYSSRYVCSLVADFHRTLIYGGWAANPREHLRLVYEANPLAFLAEQAGGRGSDGRRRILDIPPAQLHQRLPLFLGSKLDIEELESYGDVQQLSGKKYEV